MTAASAPSSTVKFYYVDETTAVAAIHPAPTDEFLPDGFFTLASRHIKIWWEENRTKEPFCYMYNLGAMGFDARYNETYLRIRDST